MAKQMYAPLFVVTNFETKPHRASLLNTLKAEARNLTKPRERNICDAVQSDSNLSVW
ncbi:hypothetical protein BH11VER1_BH11VER1_33420 [soil metagenome]